jgi:hypothetical protein
VHVRDEPLVRARSRRIQFAPKLEHPWDRMPKMVRMHSNSW